MMTSFDFEIAAKNAVLDVIEQLYKEKPDLSDISLVWFAHTLGYKKAILIDGGTNGRLYEVTYNRDSGEMYVDAYNKTLNKKFSMDETEALTSY